jgi:hypothetical protein
MIFENPDEAHVTDLVKLLTRFRALAPGGAILVDTIVWTNELWLERLKLEYPHGLPWGIQMVADKARRDIWAIRETPKQPAQFLYKIE